VLCTLRFYFYIQNGTDGHGFVVKTSERMLNSHGSPTKYCHIAW
jgi:hypothetical protein